MWKYFIICFCLCNYLFSYSLVVNEKPFVIIIPSYNNAKWYELNLSSVFSQNYSNYRIIYINDCSSDETLSLVKGYVSFCGQENRMLLINNSQRKGALANFYYAVHSCHNDEIIISLDGDDWFKHKNVLAKLNTIYQSPKVWMTYGSYEEYPLNYGIASSLPSYVINQNGYRNFTWVTTHVKTFYAKLFKQIRHEDLLYQGKFYEFAWDFAIMFPMLEMAQYHSYFIPDILYVYNRVGVLPETEPVRAMRVYITNVIRSEKKYRPLAEEEFNML